MVDERAAAPGLHMTTADEVSQQVEGELPASEGLELRSRRCKHPSGHRAAAPGGTRSQSLIIHLCLEATEPVVSRLNEASVAHAGLEEATLASVFSSTKRKVFSPSLTG